MSEERVKWLNELLSVLAVDRAALRLDREAIKETEARIAGTVIGKRLATIREHAVELKTSIASWERQVRENAVQIWHDQGCADKKVHPFVTCIELRTLIVDDKEQLLKWCRENAQHLLVVDMDAVKKIADTLPAESGVRVETVPSARIATDLSSMIEV